MNSSLVNLTPTTLDAKSPGKFWLVCQVGGWDKTHSISKSEKHDGQ